MGRIFFPESKRNFIKELFSTFQNNEIANPQSIVPSFEKMSHIFRKILEDFADQTLDEDSMLAFRNRVYNEIEKRPILIVCALQEEFQVIEQKLKDNNIPVIKNDWGTLRVNINEEDIIFEYFGGMGNKTSEIETIKKVNAYHPKFVILFGIAAGFKEHKVQLSDIIMTGEIWDLTEGKFQKGQISFSPRSISSPQKIYRNTDQLKEYLKQKGYKDIEIHTDLLCGSGNWVIRDESIMGVAMKTHRKLGAYEMEAAGVASGCINREKPIPFLIIKSISDYGEDQSESDKEPYSRQRQKCLDLLSEAIIHCFLKNNPQKGDEIPAK